MGCPPLLRTLWWTGGSLLALLAEPNRRAHSAISDDSILKDPRTERQKIGNDRDLLRDNMYTYKLRVKVTQFGDLFNYLLAHLAQLHAGNRNSRRWEGGSLNKIFT